MSKDTVLSHAEINKLVKKFDSDFKDVILGEEAANNEAIEQLNTNTADRTYDLIAALLDLSDKLYVYPGIPLAGYRSFLVERGLAPARGTNNPYLPFVKAVFSELKNGAWVFGKEHRSREKYANVLRHLADAQLAGTLTGTVQDYIRGYSTSHGVKMKGIEAQDRADNPSKGAADRVESLRKAGRNARAQATITNSFGVENRKVVVLYGQANSNGQVEILKAEALNDNEADKFFYKLGLELKAAEK